VQATLVPGMVLESEELTPFWDQIAYSSVIFGQTTV